MMTPPNAIRELRVEHGETLEELAEIIDISRDALRNYEVGKQDVRSEIAKKIAAMGVELEHRQVNTDSKMDVVPLL